MRHRGSGAGRRRLGTSRSYRYNARKGDDAGRFTKAGGRVAGKRLTYKKLTAVRSGRGPVKGFDWRNRAPAVG